MLQRNKYVFNCIFGSSLSENLLIKAILSCSWDCKPKTDAQRLKAAVYNTVTDIVGKYGMTGRKDAHDGQGRRKAQRFLSNFLRRCLSSHSDSLVRPYHRCLQFKFDVSFL